MNGTRTDLRVEIDERTKEELQPPCEAYIGQARPQCEAPAVWITVSRCPNCGPRPVKLRCSGHLAALVSGLHGLHCVDCDDKHTADFVRVEPLR